MRAGVVSRRAVFLGAALLFAAAAIAGFLAARHLSVFAPPGTAPAPPVVDQGVIGTRRPEFSLPDLEGRLRHASEWNGRVLAVNFWATWCPPCRQEIPEFVALQKKYGDRGLQFVGIALEQGESVRSFAEEYGINYPVLTGLLDVVGVAQAYGNAVGALPFTAVVDRSGRIAFIKAGPLRGDAAEEIILPLL